MSARFRPPSRAAYARVATELEPLARQAYQAKQCSVLLNGGARSIGNPAMDITPQVITALNAKITQFTFDRERLDHCRRRSSYACGQPIVRLRARARRAPQRPDARSALLRRPGPWVTLGEIAELTGAAAAEDDAADREIRGVSVLHLAGAGDVTFFSDRKHAAALMETLRRRVLRRGAGRRTSCSMAAPPWSCRRSRSAIAAERPTACA